MNQNNKKVPDCVHNAVMEAFNRLEESQEAASRRHILSPKKIAAIALAAVLCLTMMVTAFAYGDEIWAAIFQRQKELIDDKQAHINETASVGEISLSVDTMTINRSLEENLFLDIEVSIHNEKGVFENGLNCRASKIEMLVKDGMELHDYNKRRYETGEWYTIYAFDRDNYNANPNINMSASDSSTVLIVEQGLHSAGYGLEDKTDTIKIAYDVVGSYTDYRITYYDLTSYDGSTKYADEISVTFSLEKEDAAPLQQLDMYEPCIEFKLEGFTYQLEEVDMTPNQLTVKFRNDDMETFELDGEEYLAINLLCGFNCTPEFIETLEGLDRLREEYCGRAEEMYNSDEYNDLLFRNMLVAVPTEDQSLLDHCYELAADLKPECGAEVTKVEREGKSVSSGTVISVGSRLVFSSPIYAEDIERLYLRKIGNPSMEVTIWTPSDDEKLSEFINKPKYPSAE